MADDIEITAGSGTPVKTDEINGKHYQRVKLTDGTAESTTAIAAGGGVQAGALRVTVATDSTGVLSVDDNGGTLSVDDGDGTLTVDGTVTANLGATDNAVLDDIADKLGDMGVDTGATAGSAASLAGCVAGTEVQVDVVSGTVTANLGATDNAVLDDIASSSTSCANQLSYLETVAGELTDLTSTEDAAHSSGATGVYMLAVRDDALGAHSGSDNDYESLHTNNNGALYVETIPGAQWSANGDYAAAQTNASLKAAPGAGSHYLTDIVVTNDATAAITVKLLNGSGGTNLTGTHKIPVSGGLVINLRTPIKLSATTALCLTTTGTSNFSVFVSGYTAA